MYKPNFIELDKLAEDGYLRRVISPCGKLVLYNYTDKCTYEKKWNKHTLHSRGNIYELSTGKTICMTFPKFFNYSELTTSEQRNLLKRKFVAYEKLDGSLVNFWYYDNKWNSSTRGSFTSDQAIKAMEIFNKTINTKNMVKHFTYTFEVIYPENKIIVNYGNVEKLVLLEIFKDDNTLCTDNIEREAEYINVTYPKTYAYTWTELFDLQKSLSKNEEGFVLAINWETRVKIKGEEYLKAARLKTLMTPLSFWEAMVNGKVRVDLLEQLEEEFRDDCDVLKTKLETLYSNVKAEINQDINTLWLLNKDLIGYDNLSSFVHRRFGLTIKEFPDKIKHKKAIFNKLKGKNIDKYIMNTIRPTNNILE